MAVIAVASAKGSPGVSATALALALSWPTRTILAECDPAGGDALSGYLGGQLEMAGGIAELPVAHARGKLDVDFWAQLVDLDAPRRERLLLPGVREAAESGGVATIADRVATLFAELERADPSYDVVVDAGRLAAPNTLWPVLGRADALALVVRGTLPSLAHAHAAVTELRTRFAREGWNADGLGLLVVDEGPYVAEAAKRLELPLFGVLSRDKSTAKVLSFGGELRRSDRLLRSMSPIHKVLREQITSGRTAQPEVSYAR